MVLTFDRFKSAALAAMAILSLSAYAFGQAQTGPPSARPAGNTTVARPKSETARIWANEPPLLRAARDHFREALTEVDAKFFAAVAANDWADFRLTPETKYDATEPASWNGSVELPADRLIWLCTDPVAVKLVPSHGVWLRGVQISGKVDLYRYNVPFSLTFYDCLFDDGLNIAHAELQELDLRNSCSAGITARAVRVAENIYFSRSAVLGGCDFVEAQIGGDFDFNNGLAFHGTKADEVEKPGVAIDLYDAKIGGDVKLSDKFRALGQVRLVGAQIGRSFDCSGGSFAGNGQTAIDARRCQVAGNVMFEGDFKAEGGVEMRRAKIGGDFDCDGGRFIASDVDAINADLVDVGGQVHMGDGFHAKGEVRLINASVAGDVDCDNGEFIHPEGDALSLDGAVIGRSLRLGVDLSTATAESGEGPEVRGFFARGTVRLFGTKVEQDMLCGGGEFHTPEGLALLACNIRVGSRVVLTAVDAEGTVNLVSAQVEHELDFRGSHFDGRQTPGHVALSCNGMVVHGHVYCNRLEGTKGDFPFRVEGEFSVKFATIDMHWDLSTSRLTNADGNALDARDTRVGGYVNLDGVAVDGMANFSRAKIDGVWILVNVEHPERFTLDLRFAHIWVIKDERLNDWPGAGHLYLEGLVYDHFDDSSPLDVEDRIAWLARQYATADASRAIPALPTQKAGAPPVVAAAFQQTAPAEPPLAEAKQDAQAADANSMNAEAPSIEETPFAPRAFSAPPEPIAGSAERGYVTQPYTQLSAVYRAIGQDEQANRVLVARAARLGELSPPFSAHGLWYRYVGRLIGYGYEPFRAVRIGVAIVLFGAIVFAIGNRRNLMAATKLAEQVFSKEGEPLFVSNTYPRFNPFVYSLDVFLPFVDLQQICYWLPGEITNGPRKSRNCLLHAGPFSLKWSAVLRMYLWFQTLAGWTLCTLLAAAVTGIVKS